jgi:site-specific DNA-methyltransferase (adenine-specific)
MAENVMNIEDLQQDSKNFNKGTEQGQTLMEQSFTELGAGRSILIDKNGNIIAGNKSQKAAMKAGIKRVRVIETDGTELVAVKRTDIDIDSADGRKLALLDNLTNQVNLTWDKAELSTVQSELDGFDVGDFGFDIDTLPEFSFDGEDEKESTTKEYTNVEDDDFDPDAKFETKVQAGDIWLLGEHKLICGDSTDPANVLRLLGEEKADCWLTDPPYNVAYEGKTKEKLTIKNDSKDDASFRAFLVDAFTAAAAGMKEGAAFYIWHADSEGFNFRYAVKNTDLLLKQCLIWNKNQLVMGRQDYQWKHEPCLYGWKEGAAHKFFNDRKQSTCIEFPRPKRSEEHPTMKPVPLFAYLMANSTEQGDLVLDSFGGSGTTLIAAEQLNRKACLMELSPVYCDVIIARWEKLTGQKAIKLNP